MNVLYRAQDTTVVPLSISTPHIQVAYIMEINIDLRVAFDRFTYYAVYTHEILHGRNPAINIRYFPAFHVLNQPNSRTICAGNITKN
jgi:hypothetical protein